MSVNLIFFQTQFSFMQIENCTWTEGKFIVNKLDMHCSIFISAILLQTSTLEVPCDNWLLLFLSNAINSFIFIWTQGNPGERVQKWNTRGYFLVQKGSWFSYWRRIWYDNSSLFMKNLNGFWEAWDKFVDNFSRHFRGEILFQENKYRQSWWRIFFYDPSCKWYLYV